MVIPTLETKRLVLRPFEHADASVVQHLAGHPAVAATTLTIPHPYQDGMAEEWISSHQSNWDARRILALAVTTVQEGLVGAISLKLDNEHNRGSLGYWIGVPYWNRGFATEAASAMMRFGFHELGLNRIEAQYFASNPASGRVMEKLGMKPEGVLRQHIIKSDVPQDVVLYGLLASEYDGG